MDNIQAANMRLNSFNLEFGHNFYEKMEEKIHNVSYD